MAILKNKTIPPQTGIDELDPAIDLENSNVRISFESVELNTDEDVFCGVSAFGFTGTNVHAIFKSAEDSSHNHEGYRDRAYSQAWPEDNLWIQ